MLAGLVALSVCVAFLLREPKRTPTGDPLPEEAVERLRITELITIGVYDYTPVIVQNDSNWKVTAIRFDFGGLDVWGMPQGTRWLLPSQESTFICIAK